MQNYSFLPGVLPVDMLHNPPMTKSIVFFPKLQNKSKIDFKKLIDQNYNIIKNNLSLYIENLTIDNFIKDIETQNIDIHLYEHNTDEIYIQFEIDGAMIQYIYDIKYKLFKNKTTSSEEENNKFLKLLNTKQFKEAYKKKLFSILDIYNFE